MKVEKESACPATRLLTLLSKRHMLLILYTLTKGESGFVELQETLHINTASLSIRLRELQDAQLIARRECKKDSRQHYYYLTTMGIAISRLIEHISTVARNNIHTT